MGGWSSLALVGNPSTRRKTQTPNQLDLQVWGLGTGLTTKSGNKPTCYRNRDNESRKQLGSGRVISSWAYDADWRKPSGSQCTDNSSDSQKQDQNRDLEHSNPVWGREIYTSEQGNASLQRHWMNATDEWRHYHLLWSWGRIPTRSRSSPARHLR